jgi:hypothetical protein
LIKDILTNFKNIVDIKITYVKYSLELNYKNCMFLDIKKDRKNRRVVSFLDDSGNIQTANIDLGENILSLKIIKNE